MAEYVQDAVLTEEETAEDTMHGKYLVFFLDEQEFAISIALVVDIINIQPFTRIPNCPGYVRGITNLRGKVIPIIDVRMRFGKTPQEYHDRTCIIVVEEGGITVGLVIDSVNEVISLEDDQISPPPNFNGNADGAARFVCGIGQAESGIKMILDCHAVLSDDAPADSQEDIG